MLDEREGRNGGGVRRTTAVGRVAGAIAIVLALVAVGVGATGSEHTQAAETGTMLVGVTHGQYSADSWGNPTAVAQARSILRSSFPIQAQHLMGWGALNPEPSPGVYNFSSLDQRVALMRSTGARPVITLCCSPDWMAGAPAGTTDWTKNGQAPLESHFDDFAALAATVARRYPDVQDYLVWNELKGFFDAATNDWESALYTELYNKVYAALKAVNPAIRVGGPYITMNSWSSPAVMSNPSKVSGAWGTVDQRSLDVISYWLTHATGADFVVVDGGISNRDGVDPPTVDAVAKFDAIDHWLQTQTTLPIFWAEIHLGANSAHPDGGTAELLNASLGALARSGASYVLLWQPQGTATRCVLCMWTDTTAGGGQPSIPYLSVLGALSRQPVSAEDFIAPPLPTTESWPVGIAEANSVAVRLGP